jgi:hypothetical protein
MAWIDEDPEDLGQLLDFKLSDENLYKELCNIEIPLTVVTISLRKCRINKVPKDFFMKFDKLESIDLYANSIESFDFNIPDGVTEIDLSYNKVRSIDSDINNLEHINLSYNFLNHFSSKLKDIRYNIDHNDIPQKYIHMRDIAKVPDDIDLNNYDREQQKIELEERDIAKVPDDIDLNNYDREQQKIELEERDRENDRQRAERLLRQEAGHVGDVAGPIGVHGQGRRDQRGRIRDNVHETNIQESTRKSIKYLMDDSFKKFPREHNYLHDIAQYQREQNYKDHGTFVRFFVKTFGLHYSRYMTQLKYYESFKNRIVYDYSGNKSCTTSQILERIWAHAKNDKNKDSIIANLFIQMKEGIHVCFVGKYTRLINTLSSFVDDVETEIPINTQITNRIVDLQNKDFSKDDIIKNVMILMKELKVSEEDQEPWIDAIRES